MSRSPIFSAALDDWRELRNDWAILIEDLFSQAEEATRGNLLNRRGQRAGIEPYTLFYGREARAYAYASDELIEFWQHHPRVPFSTFEAQAFSRPDTSTICALCALSAEAQEVTV